MKPSTYRLIGVGFVAVLLALIWLTKAAFEQQLTSSRTISLLADRAGLMMVPGNGVELRGVNIGRVQAVTSTSYGVRLALAIQPRYFNLIPANATAQIIPPTAFGPKYVSLQVPATPSAPIAEGAVIANQHVTVEANQAFSELLDTLNAAKPSLVNSALNSMADALNGKGAQMGQLITAANRYLTELNQVAPAMSVDIQRARSVLTTYRQVTPNLLSIMRNATVTSRTVTEQSAAIDSLLLELGASADTSRAFLSANEAALVRTVNLLAPTTRLLADYAPMLSCTIEGMAYFNKQSIPALGGNQPGVATNTRLFPSQNPYLTPQNLPKIAATNPPACYGLPIVKPSQIKGPHIVANTGANPWQTATTTTLPGLSNTLFGVLAGMPGL